ncbi:MAG TPA: phage/plasmid primase, P4 family [Vineibacter sp.]|nr:phage/plasmid primase, P4 family [Vineibacter sp.]
MTGDADYIDLSRYRPQQRSAASDDKPDATLAAQLAQSPEGSEDWLALQLARRHRQELRHVAAWNTWLRWDGNRWTEDRTTYVFDLARARLRDFIGTLKNDGSARKIASASTVAGIERLARSDRTLAATAEQWDADAFALNTPGGIVDLRTGDLRPCDPLAYCTKCAAVAPAPLGTLPPLWLKFLDFVTDGDAELIGFLQRVAGYALTGDVSEHALFFAAGFGGNGKGTTFNTLRAVFGDYGMTAPAEVFLASTTDRHPTELAGLRGARLVVASEVDKGRRWNEARIKSLTGGDPVRARFMRQDFFEFMPQFKLVVFGNHRPSLSTVDEAIRRRLNLLPFNVTITPDIRDRALPDKLKDEWPAILRWAIDGCLDWQAHGLQPPPAVIAATQKYFDDEDSVAAWLDECTQPVRAGFETNAALFGSWKPYADRAGERAGNVKWLSEALRSKGWEMSRATDRARTRGFKGIQIVRLATEDDRYGD